MDRGEVSHSSGSGSGDFGGKGWFTGGVVDGSRGGGRQSGGDRSS